jgi:transposase
MSEVCRAFGISRKTGYKIFERYKEHGLEALTDRSPRPVRYANQLPRQIESLIVAAKRDKPHWGARKIRELLVRRLDGDIRVPAKSTIHAVLHRHGLVKIPGRLRHRAFVATVRIVSPVCRNRGTLGRFGHGLAQHTGGRPANDRDKPLLGVPDPPRRREWTADPLYAGRTRRRCSGDMAMIANGHFRQPPAIPILHRGRVKASCPSEGKAPCPTDWTCPRIDRSEV